MSARVIGCYVIHPSVLFLLFPSTQPCDAVVVVVLLLFPSSRSWFLFAASLQIVLRSGVREGVCASENGML